MKTNPIFNKIITGSTFLLLAFFGVSAQAEYYFVVSPPSPPVDESPKCVSVKRYTCVKRYYPRKIIRHHRCYRPPVRHFEIERPVIVPTCASGCYSYYSSCPTCYNTGDYYVSF